MNGKYNNLIDEYLIIDSRYPYEFDGGHIIKAANIYSKEKLADELFVKRLNLKNTNNMVENELSNLVTEAFHQKLDGGKRLILIFHCEFSSERAPGL